MRRLSRYSRQLWLIMALAITTAECPALANSPSDTSVQTAAGFARFAGAFCGTSQQSIADYKRAVRSTIRESGNFESDWQYGWASALNRIIDYRDLRARNPKDFAARVKDDCNLVRWEAPKQAREFCMSSDNAHKSALCH